MSTLDALVDGRFEASRIAVKIDVEGGEWDLLRGAARTLDRRPAPAWIVEVSLSENHPGGSNPRFTDTFDVFFARGYRAWTVDAAGEREVTAADVASWSAAGRRGFGTMNYLFRRIA